MGGEKGRERLKEEKKKGEGEERERILVHFFRGQLFVILFLLEWMIIKLVVGVSQ